MIAWAAESAAPVTDLATHLEASPLSQLVRESTWLYPILETVHIWGFVVLVGAVIMFDLRVLGLSRRLPVDDLARHLLPWSAGALLVIVPSGLAMFASDAGALVSNRALLTKLCLVFLAGCNAAAFHIGPYRSVAQWRSSVPTPLLARAQAALSLMLWLSVIVCGRLIAYL
jgi:hypothetical protein